ncbi:MAG TPA: tetratricopeptide repeat protein [Blastocatellia bacterium]
MGQAKRLVFIGLVSLLGCSFNGRGQSPLAHADDLMAHGDYKGAVSAFQSLLQKDPANHEAACGLLTADLETGAYTNAESTARDFLAKNPGDAAVRNLLAKALLSTGRLAEAQKEFESAVQSGKGADWLRATLGRAQTLKAEGREDEAQSTVRQFISYYNTNQPHSAPELTVIAKGMHLLEKYEDANNLYIDARKADKDFVEALVGQGELLQEKYQYGDAAASFADALKINPNLPEAHYGIAECKRLDSSTDTEQALSNALLVNPNYVDAINMFAASQLESDKPDQSADTAARALKVNPNSTGAIAIQASIAYLKDRKPELDEKVHQDLAINPHDGMLYDTLAHFAIMNRRYKDAVEFERHAVELSPHLWSAWTELGIELLRIGQEGEGRSELEKAFASDRYNVWAKNTLDLLDSMRDYAETVRGPFLIKSEGKDAASVAPYAADLLDEAYKTLSAKYKFAPRGPITVEIFPNHADFAVRSLGLPGLGALGVCFGQVIAMDGPSARDVGHFNWGSTLWHEFTHVITLEMTDHRIPRWFSEGLSVYEERHARPGWGERWSLEMASAFKVGQFVKIEDLDAAFTQPKSPNQVQIAYFQASLVCDFVEKKFGFDAILRMLGLYREGASTPDVFQRALGMSFAQFDTAFSEFLKAQAGRLVTALGAGPDSISSPSVTKEVLQARLAKKPDDYFAHLKLASLLKSEHDSEHAIAEYLRAEQLFPFYVGPGNPYTELADLYKAAGDKEKEAGELSALSGVDDTSNDGLKRLADLRLGSGDRKAALEALQSCFYINPYDPALHKLAGDAYLEEGNSKSAVAEFQIEVALKPPDEASAHYDLARAFLAAGKAKEAKSEVLRSLELAPEFDKAQELLLKLRENN